MVGAVVVSPAGVVIGQGAHQRAGDAHAEVIALEAAGSAASGSTLYCTLEPCSHVGRTGPCAERIVACGVTRVVAAMRDPNPRVSGGGFAYLRNHGVDVTTGDGEAPAQRLNAPFVTWMTQQRPFVIVKSVQSADGFIGQLDARVALSGPAANRHFHGQRAEVDAIAVGSRTVLVDDPLLTARLVYRERPLVRVLFDWRLQIPASARVFSTRQFGPVIMIVGRTEAERRPGDVEARRAWGCDVEVVADHDIEAVLRRLADRGVLSLLVEGGAGLQTAFVEAGLVDRVQRLRTPVVLGRGVTPPVLPNEPRPGDGWPTTTLGADALTVWDVHGTD
jgi:diaminohydroxyphosphoribosylaminopyrimidine deaminase/5-amino-6-(5-phosphoribosylamino)uracil reductase